jgi:hypothetical protein
MNIDRWPYSLEIKSNQKQKQKRGGIQRNLKRS